MQLQPETVEVLLIAAIALTVAALGVGLAALQGQRRTREAYRKFALGQDEDVLALLARHIDGVEALRAEVGSYHAQVEQLRELIRTSLSRIATVRYDAFDEMGGRLSYSTAILDEHGDGIVLSSINGRTETRTYAKAISKGESPHNLSAEEKEAIAYALSQRGRTETLSQARHPSRGARVARLGRARDAS